MTPDRGRAWKDEAYRQSLLQEDRQHLPENPVGALEDDLELSDCFLENRRGGQGPFHPTAHSTIMCTRSLM